MTLKPFFIRSIPSPNLKFASNRFCKTPLEGLRKFGPFDQKLRKFDKLKIIVIIPSFATRDAEKFLNVLQKVSEELLKIKLKVIDKIVLNRDQRKNITSYLQTVSHKIDSLSNKEGVVVLQILDRKSTSRTDNPYFELRKRLLAREGIPVQSVVVSNIQERRIRKLKAKSGNILLGIYAKNGGRPWQLYDPVSKMFNRVIYVGYDISRVGENKRVGTTVVYDNQGQLIYSTPLDIPTTGEVISRRDVKTYIRNVLIDATGKNKNNVDLVVIHRDGEIYDEEVEGILSAVQEFDRTLPVIIVSIPKSGSVPLFINYGNNEYGLASNGYYLYIGKKNMQNTFLLQTYGFAADADQVTEEEFKKRSMKRRIVNALQYRVVKISRNLLQTPSLNLDELYHDIAQQIFYLSRLNWGSGFGQARLPVTVHYAHKASKLLSSGVSSTSIRWDKLWMI